MFNLWGVASRCLCWRGLPDKKNGMDWYMKCNFHFPFCNYHTRNQSPFTNRKRYKTFWQRILTTRSSSFRVSEAFSHISVWLPSGWFSVLSHDPSMEFRRKKVVKLGEEIVTLVSIQRWSLASGVNGHLDFSPALLWPAWLWSLRSWERRKNKTCTDGRDWNCIVWNVAFG